MKDERSQCQHSACHNRNVIECTEHDGLIVHFCREHAPLHWFCSNCGRKVILDEEETLYNGVCVECYAEEDVPPDTEGITLDDSLDTLFPSIDQPPPPEETKHDT